MQPWWKKWLKKSYQPNLLNSSVRFISKCNCFIFELLQNNSYYLALIHECQCSFKNPLTRGILKKDLSSTILCNRFVMSWRLNWFSLFAWCFLTQGVADDYFRAWPICTWLPFSWPQISFSWFFSDLLAIVSQKMEYAIPRFPRMIGMPYLTCCMKPGYAAEGQRLWWVHWQFHAHVRAGSPLLPSPLIFVSCGMLCWECSDVTSDTLPRTVCCQTDGLVQFEVFQVWK